jgi:AraC-like DNA-binding protein
LAAERLSVRGLRNFDGPDSRRRCRPHVLGKSSRLSSGHLPDIIGRQIGHAIALVHREPARPWTVESLANEVAMSRSAFAARFTELVGEPAMHYVARWRMHVALTWLKEEDAPVSEMASRLGYESEAAFSRAFKRFLGFPPGAVRRASGRPAGESAPA